MVGKEIERKFLLSGFPDDCSSLEFKGVSEMFQIYMSVEPEVRARLRFTDGAEHATGKLTVKSSDISSENGMVRNEVNIETMESQVKEWIKLIGKKPIYKICKSYKLDTGETLDVCAVDNDFFYAEVEFETAEEAEAFRLPEMRQFIREVTDEKEYYMKNYWVATRC